MKLVNVEIRGTSPLLQHRFTEADALEAKTRRIEVTLRDPREEADKVAYKDEKTGIYYFSAFSIPGTMGNAGTNHKVRGSRKSLRYVVPSAVRTVGEAIDILDFDGEPYRTFEVDSRPVTIPATKGRIMRHRPRWDKWTAKFQLSVDEELLSLDTAHALLSEAGKKVGIGDYSPRTKGPFGCFQVVSWQEAK